MNFRKTLCLFCLAVGVLAFSAMTSSENDSVLTDPDSKINQSQGDDNARDDRIEAREDRETTEEDLQSGNTEAAELEAKDSLRARGDAQMDRSERSMRRS